MYKLLLAVGLLLSSGCAMRRYQVVVMDANSGSSTRLAPQCWSDAEMKAAIINALAQGNALAYVQHRQPEAKEKDTVTIKLPKETKDQ